VNVGLMKRREKLECNSILAKYTRRGFFPFDFLIFLSSDWFDFWLSVGMQKILTARIYTGMTAVYLVWLTCVGIHKLKTQSYAA